MCCVYMWFFQFVFFFSWESCEMRCDCFRARICSRKSHQRRVFTAAKAFTWKQLNVFISMLTVCAQTAEWWSSNADKRRSLPSHLHDEMCFFMIFVFVLSAVVEKHRNDDSKKSLTTWLVDPHHCALHALPCHFTKVIVEGAQWPFFIAFFVWCSNIWLLALHTRMLHFTTLISSEDDLLTSFAST